MSRRVVRAIAVGSLLLAAVAVALLVTRGPDGQRVTAVFEQAYGLVKGGQVVAGGVPVGTIASVDLGRDGLPHVAMHLDGDVRVREGARADLRQLSNSGQLNRYVLLELGHGAVLRDGAVISTAQTDQPVEIDQVLDTFEPHLRADVRAVLGALDDSTARLAPAFRAGLRNSAQAFRESAAVLAQVAHDGRALRTLVAQGAKLSGALRAERPALGATVDQLAGFLQTTAARSDELGTAIARMPAGLRGPRRALDRLRAAVPELDGLVTDAAPAVVQLGPAARALSAALPATRRTLVETARLARRSPPDLRSLRRLLPDIQSTLARMTPALRLALPILDNVRVYTPDITGLLAAWSAVNSTYDAVGHGARIFPTNIAPPATSRPPTSNAPGYIAPPFVRTPGSAGGDPWPGYASSFLARAGER
jgi:phospholipid/cholesterol/gamma-HCH transport system substrate-binding protein